MFTGYVAFLCGKNGCIMHEGEMPVKGLRQKGWVMRYFPRPLQEEPAFPGAAAGPAQAEAKGMRADQSYRRREPPG
jgi:hypothetical protein